MAYASKKGALKLKHPSGEETMMNAYFQILLLTQPNVSPPKRVISSFSHNSTQNQVVQSSLIGGSNDPLTCGNEFQYALPPSPKTLVPVATRVLIIQVEREN